MRVDPARTRTLHHPDPDVQEVLDVWAARFLHGQIALGDLTGTVDRIKSWSDWGPEWMVTARAHEDMGEQAWGEGRRISAVGSYLAAAACEAGLAAQRTGQRVEVATVARPAFYRSQQLGVG